jgi:hypothetical protein
MAERLLTTALPNTPTVTDTSTAETPPAGFTVADRNVLEVVEDLMAAANARLYFDALGNIIIRDRLAALDDAGSAGADRPDMSYSLDVVEYELEFSRDRVANKVIVRWSDGDTAADIDDTLEGTATLSSGPLAYDGDAGRLVSTYQHQILVASQAKANAYAADLLTATSQAYLQARITAVQDPRLEPDDVIDVEYLDGRTLRHRITTVELDVGTGAMRLTGRTSLPSET